MSRRQIKAPCFDCGVDTLATGGDWYMVHNHLWKLAWPNTKQPTGRAMKPFSEILCLRCLELRLDRALRAGISLPLPSTTNLGGGDDERRPETADAGL